MYTPDQFIEEPARPLRASIIRGLRCRCPNCGEGPVFQGFLQVRPQCSHCGEDLSHQRADDLPAYLNIFIVGHVVIGFMLLVMQLDLMGMWTTTIVTALLCVIAAFTLMRPLKGMVVGMQWALRMHGFGGDHD